MKGKGIYFIWLLVILTVNLFVLSKNSLFFLSNWILTVADLSALIGTTLLSVSFFLSSRMPILDYLFSGLDKAYRTHQLVSEWSFLLILNHFIFLIISRFPAGKISMLFIPSFDISYTAAIFAFWLMVYLIILTLFVDLPYHIWKQTHQYFGLVILLGMIHAMTITSDISLYMPLRYFMLSLMTFGLSCFIYRKYLYGFIGPRFSYQVISAEKKVGIIELRLIPLGKKMPFIPGQFAFLSIADNKLGNEDHPFSMSSGPSENTLRFSVKAIGDYTEKLKELIPGAKVSVWGPYGNFGERLYSRKNAIFIAGGIGISPFLSMIRSAVTAGTGKRINLYYSIKTPDEAVYDHELTGICKTNPSFCYQPHISQTNGRLTAEKIKETVLDLEKRLVFLCGPPAMMLSLRDQFIAIGIKKRNIIFEDFNLK